jgi:hypothetical protein
MSYKIWHKEVVGQIMEYDFTHLFCFYYYFKIYNTHGEVYWAQTFNLLNPTGHVMHQQFKIQQLYALPTLYLCALYLSENKQRLVPLTA